MDALENLQDMFSSMNGDVVALVFRECNKDVSMATERLLDMSASSTELQPGTSRSHDRKSRSHDYQPLSHDREWPDLNMHKSQIGSNAKTIHGNQERVDVNRANRKMWNQKRHGYQYGNEEYEAIGRGKEVVGSPFFPPGLRGPGGSHREVASGSRMGPLHGPGSGSQYRGINRYSDYYPSDIGMGWRPFVPGMSYGYDFYTCARMSNGVYHQMPSHYYYENQLMMRRMGEATGPHPPIQRPHAPYPIAMMKHGADIDYREMWEGPSGHGHSERPNPPHKMCVPPYSDHPNTLRDKHKIGDDTSERRREARKLVPNYSLPSCSQSAEEVTHMGSGRRDRKTLVLLRGLPGSGKSTLAKSLVGSEGEICCTDDFFICNGQYTFDRDKLSENHEKNKKKARAAMVAGRSPVIIDNTNTTSWEMKPYVMMAVKELDYSVEILEPQTPWRFKTMELARRNTHNVPRQTLDRLLERFEHRVSVDSILRSSTPPYMRSNSSSCNEQQQGGKTIPEHDLLASTRYQGSRGALSPKPKVERRLKFVASSEGKSVEERGNRSGTSPDVKRSRLMYPPKLPEGGDSVRGSRSGSDEQEYRREIEGNEERLCVGGSGTGIGCAEGKEVGMGCGGGSEARIGCEGGSEAGRGCGVGKGDGGGNKAAIGGNSARRVCVRGSEAGSGCVEDGCGIGSNDGRGCRVRSQTRRGGSGAERGGSGCDEGRRCGVGSEAEREGGWGCEEGSGCGSGCEAGSGSVWGCEEGSGCGSGSEAGRESREAGGCCGGEQGDSSGSGGRSNERSAGRCSETSEDSFLSSHNEQDSVNVLPRCREYSQRSVGAGGYVADRENKYSCCGGEDKLQRSQVSVQKQRKPSSPFSIHSDAPRITEEGLLDSDVAMETGGNGVTNSDEDVSWGFSKVGNTYTRARDIVRSNETVVTKEKILAETRRSKKEGHRMSEDSFECGNISKGPWLVAIQHNHGDREACEAVELRRWKGDGKANKRGNKRRGKDVEEDVWDSSEEMDLSRVEEGDEIVVRSGLKETERQSAGEMDTGSSGKGAAMTGHSNVAMEPGLKQQQLLQPDRQKQRLQELEDALESTHHEIYTHEGRIDEFKFTLQDQKLLVTQLITEHQSVFVETGDGDDVEPERNVSPSMPVSVGVGPVDDFCLSNLSLTAMFDRAKIDHLRDYLPDRVVEVMFADRQLVPNPQGITSGMESKSHEIDTLFCAPRMESRLLKFLATDVCISGSEKLEPNLENGSVTDDDEVDDPAIVHKVKSMPQLQRTPPTMTEGLHIVMTTALEDFKVPPSTTLGASFAPMIFSQSPSHPAAPKPVVDVLPTSIHSRSQVWGESVSQLQLLNMEPSMSTEPVSLSFFLQASSSQAGRDLLTAVFSTGQSCPSTSDSERELNISKPDCHNDASADEMGFVDGYDSLLVCDSSSTSLLTSKNESSIIPSYFPPAFDSEFSVVQKTASCDLETESRDCNQRNDDDESRRQSNSSAEVSLHSAVSCEDENGDDIVLAHSSSNVRDKFHSEANLFNFPVSTTVEGVAFVDGHTSNGASNSKAITMCGHFSKKESLKENHNSAESGSDHSSSNTAENGRMIDENVLAGSNFSMGSYLPHSHSMTTSQHIIPSHTPHSLLDNFSETTEGMWVDINPICSTRETLSSNRTSDAKKEFSQAKRKVEESGDICFLIECFPDLDRHYLQQLLVQNGGSVEDTVSIALLSSPVGSDHAHFDYFPVDLSHAHDNRPGVYVTQSRDGSSYNTGNLGIANLTPSTTSATTERFPVHHHDSGVSAYDYDISAKLQEVVGNGAESQSHDSVLQLEAWVDPTTEEEHELQGDKGKNSFFDWNVEEADNVLRNECVPEAEDNLVLKLTPSLARQLQSLFGAVDRYLPVEGAMRVSDLDVLLSEKAAAEIHHKWMDTLKAKKVECQVRTELLLKSASSDSHGSVAQVTKADRMGVAQIESRKKNCKPAMKVHNKPYVMATGSHGFGSYNKEETLHQLNSVDSIELSQDLATPPKKSNFSTGRTHPFSKPKPHPPESCYVQPTQQKQRAYEHTNKLRPNDHMTDHTYQVLDYPSYNDLRAETAIHVKLRAESFHKAAHARSKKQYDVASYYAQQGHMHTEKMKESNKLAAAHTLHIQNDASSNQIDLHGLHVNEALEALEDKMSKVKPGDELLVVTGYGSHSKCKEAKIKPAIVNYLKNHGYRYEEKNRGLLQIFVECQQ